MGAYNRQTLDLSEDIKRKIARQASRYEVCINGEWQSVKVAARTPNGWLHVKLNNDEAVQVPKGKWRYKS